MADKGIGYEVFVPATFALTIVSNGIIGNKVLGGLSVADVSHLYRTAITPAGYAFAIWGPIYLAGAGFAGYCAMNPEFAAKVGPMMTANLAMNAIWIPMFCAEYQIPSLAVIWAMLGTSTAVWQQVGAPSGPAASIGEWLAVRPFTSLYTSWLAVACTVATASALTKRDRPFDKFLGAEPSTWAKAIVPTVAAITVTLGAVRHDATMPAVAAWALFAIGIKQRQDKTYPGDASVASLATAAGYVCSAAAVAVFGMTLYRGDAWVVGATS